MHIGIASVRSGTHNTTN